MDDIASKIGNNNITTDIVAETVLVSEDLNVVDFVRNAVSPENIVDATDIEIEGEYIEKPGDCSFRRKRVNEDLWKQNVNKKKRLLGKEYEGKKLDVVSGQWLSVPKPARTIGSTCTKASCVKDKKRCCEKFDEKDLQRIFTEYCRCGNNFIQGIFIQSLVDVVQISVSTLSRNGPTSRKLSLL